VGREAEEFSVDVNTPPSCTWSAASESPWITTDSRDRSGSGSFRIAVSGNAGDPRTGTVRVGTETVTVHQAGGACAYTIKPTNYHAGRGPDDVTVNVTAESGCAWSAATDATWITVAAGRSGSGSGTVRLLVEANSGPARTTVVTIAGHPFTLRQDGGCSYSITPTWYHAGRGPDNIRVNVTAPSGCTWTANSPVTWATVAEGRQGSGDGTVRLVVDANSGAARTAQLTIAGETFDLRQNGCTTTIKPTWYDAGRGPDDIRITVTADSGCTWTASSSVSWVTVAEGASGSGDGVVRLLLPANSGAPRAVTLTIAGQPFALRQDGSQ
jgi:Putative binding domain, N-terminal